jgi:hypothetical protein
MRSPVRYCPFRGKEKVEKNIFVIKTFLKEKKWRNEIVKNTGFHHNKNVMTCVNDKTCIARLTLIIHTT